MGTIELCKKLQGETSKVSAELAATAFAQKLMTNNMATDILDEITKEPPIEQTNMTSHIHDIVRNEVQKTTAQLAKKQKTTHTTTTTTTTKPTNAITTPNTSGWTTNNNQITWTTPTSNVIPPSSGDTNSEVTTSTNNQESVR